eukprot:3979292-Prymnesium_polylepis.1
MSTTDRSAGAAQSGPQAAAERPAVPLRCATLSSRHCAQTLAREWSTHEAECTERQQRHQR